MRIFMVAVIFLTACTPVPEPMSTDAIVLQTYGESVFAAPRS